MEITKIADRYCPQVSVHHAERGGPQILLGRLQERLSAAFFGDAQVFFGLWKVRMKTQGFFELPDRLGNVAFTHQNPAEVVMRLGKLWLEPGCFQIMRFCFRKVPDYEKRTSEIDMSI